MKACPHCGGDLSAQRPYAGEALLAVINFSKSQIETFTRSDVLAAVQGSTVRQVSNALAYLVRCGQLSKPGYGLYRNAPTSAPAGREE